MNACRFPERDGTEKGKRRQKGPVASWVLEKQSEMEVTVQEFLREHPWDQHLWKGGREQEGAPTVGSRAPTGQRPVLADPLGTLELQWPITVVPQIN